MLGGSCLVVKQHQPCSTLRISKDCSFPPTKIKINLCFAWINCFLSIHSCTLLAKWSVSSYFKDAHFKKATYMQVHKFEVHKTGQKASKGLGNTGMKWRDTMISTLQCFPAKPATTRNGYEIKFPGKKLREMIKTKLSTDAGHLHNFIQFTKLSQPTKSFVH